MSSSLASSVLTSPLHISLRLRLPVESDISAMIQILGDPANTEHDLSVTKLSRVEREGIARKWLTLNDPLTSMNFVVEINGEVQGISGLGWIGDATPVRRAGEADMPWDKGDRAEAVGLGDEDVEGGSEDVEDSRDGKLRAGAAGVVINPAMRGKGYAFEALRLAIDFGLNVLGLVEVRIGTTSKNLAMVGLMERKFEMQKTIEAPDRFGNDLIWRIDKERWEDWNRQRAALMD